MTELASELREQSDHTHPQCEAANQPACPICQSTFRRSEHLKRHLNIHAEQKPYQCGTCEKRFSRTDSLRRHENLHTSESEGQVTASNGSFASRPHRACKACSIARTRCIGGDPCKRCLERGSDCQPSQKRQRGEFQSTNDGAQDIHRTSISSGFSTQNLAAENGNSVLPNVDSNRIISSENSAVSFEHDMSRNQTGPRMPLQMPNVGNSEVSYGNTALEMTGNLQDPVTAGLGNIDVRRPTFDYNNFDPTGFSVLNWLPLSYPVAGFQQNELTPMSFWQPSISQDTPSQEDVSGLGPAPASRYPENPDPDHENGTSFSDRVVSESSSSVSRGLEGESITNNLSDHEATGEYYVDGNGARQTKTALRNRERLSDIASVSPVTDGSMSRPPLQIENRGTTESLGRVVPTTYISPELYQQIISCFETLQSTPSSNLFCDVPKKLPTAEVLEQLLHLSLQRFLPVVPIIHLRSIRKQHWILILALAYQGVNFIESEIIEELNVMLDFLLEAIPFVTCKNGSISPDNMQIIQAKLLACIGCIYSRDQPLNEKCIWFYEDILAFHGRFSQSSKNGLIRDDRDHSIWEDWLEYETFNRTIYYVWLLDSMQAIHTQRKKRLSMQEMYTPLPCQDNVWEADSMESWKKLRDSTNTNPSLLHALQTLYVSKKIQNSIGEFGRILLIYGLFEQTWNMKSHFLDSFSSWIPTARISATSFHKRTAHDLAVHPTYSRWRNCACDCLDVLHWSANSAIGAASGMEHPTVHHLHLARIVLLTPHEHIRSLALHCISKGDKAPYTISESLKEIQQWIIDDQYKARLAVIHTGVLFWHVRRYSVDAFYEAEGVFLASLAMWAYSRYHPSHLTNKLRTEPGADGAPTFINLDRPADDELVQLFVRSGEGMVANMAGVGNLRDEGSAVRVLRVGCRLLEKLSSWGNARRYLQLLTALGEARLESVGRD